MSTEHKHTPGPWIIAGGYHLLGGSAPSQIATLEKDDGWEIEQAANARLIAAAPDLLEMLMELDAWLAFRPDVAGEIGKARVKTLIAKATGSEVVS